MDRHAGEIEVLFLGSSHAYFGVNPDFIEKRRSFNAAHVSQTLVYDLEILKTYSDQLNSLKYLVLPIDYFTLFSEGLPETFIKNYVIYYGISIEGSLKDRIEIINGQNKLNQVFNYYLRNVTNITCNEKGWGKTYSSSNQQDLDKEGKFRALRHTAKTSKFVDKNVRVLNEIISFAKSKGVKIIFYTSPAFQTYVSRLNPTQLNTTIDKIVKVVGLNKDLYYFNFLSDNTFVKNDFWDGDHLNEIGAKKLTQKIDSIMNKIDLKDRMGAQL